MIWLYKLFLFNKNTVFTIWLCFTKICFYINGKANKFVITGKHFTWIYRNIQKTLNCFTMNRINFQNFPWTWKSNSLRPHWLYSPWNSPGQNTGVGSHSLLQGIFPTQGLNPGLQHCRWILYQLSHQEIWISKSKLISENNWFSIWSIKWQWWVKLELFNCFQSSHFSPFTFKTLILNVPKKSENKNKWNKFRKIFNRFKWKSHAS